MGNPLRDRRSPKELAATREVIDFSEKISDFGQLSGIVAGDLETLGPDNRPAGWRDTPVTGTLSFDFADAQNGLPVLEGEVSTTIAAVCQRCLEPFELPLNVELKLLFGDDEAAAANPGFEVWELDEEKFRPLDLVEEALIMALPMAALHVDNEACHGPEDETPAEKDDA